MTANELFNAALQRVESERIRAWATNDHNRPVWLEFAQKQLDANARDPKKGLVDPQRLATYMTCLAMGF